MSSHFSSQSLLRTLFLGSSKTYISHSTTQSTEYKSSEVYTPVSLFRPICPASCRLPFILQSAVLSYLLCLGLSMLSLGLGCRSSPSHPSAPLCLVNICLFQSSPQTSHSLQGFICCVPTLTPGRTTFFLGLYLHEYTVNVILTLLDCRLLQDRVSVTCISIR